MGDCVFAAGFDRMRGHEDHFSPKSFDLLKQWGSEIANQVSGCCRIATFGRFEAVARSLEMHV